MRSSRRVRIAVIAATLASFGTAPTLAQVDGADSVLSSERFRRPDPAIADAVLAPWYLNVTLGNPSPDGQVLLTLVSGGAPSMAAFATPFHRLAGEQIDWRANRDRRLTTRASTGIRLTDRATGRAADVTVPAGAGVSSPVWSPDGTSIAFLAHFDEATHVYVAERASGRSRQVTRAAVLATLVTSVAWTPDSRSVVTVLVPGGREAPPAEPAVPVGPQVRLTTPETNRIRTYPDLLETPHEMDLLEYYTTGQLAVVDVRTRRTRLVGRPAMIRSLDVSPDGRFVRVATMRRPFSYVVPASQFGGGDEVWSLEDGTVLAIISERSVRDGSPADTSSDDDTPERRSAAWRPDGQGLSFLQQPPRQPGDTAPGTGADEGQQGQRPRRRDRVYQWVPPFDSASQHVVYESTSRLSAVRYSHDAQVLFLTEQQGENIHEYAVFLKDPKTRHTIWRGRRGGFGARSRVPQLLTTTLANGVTAVRTSADGSQAFLSGTDYADDPLLEGPKSYIERVMLEGGAKERVYESENDGVYERVLEVLDDEVTLLLVSRERLTEVPNSFERNLATGELRQLTRNVDYTPDVTQAQRRRYTIKRVDGFELAADVTLPAGWSGERLPGMVWFYPREYTD